MHVAYQLNEQALIELESAAALMLRRSDLSHGMPVYSGLHQGHT